MKTRIELGRREFLELTALAGGGMAVDLIGATEAEAQARPAPAAPAAPAGRAAQPRPATTLGSPGAVMPHAPNPINPKPWLPPVQGGIEIGPWLVIHPDNYVTIRFGSNEEGQGAFTSNTMMFCEELEADWSKVRAVYADGQRQAIEQEYSVVRSGDAPRMAGGVGGAGASSSVRNGRWTLQQAGAQVRERLRFAASIELGVPIDEVVAKNSILTHRPTGRTLTYGQVAARAAKLAVIDEPHIKKPSEYSTIIGKRVRLLDTEIKSRGEAVFGIDVVLPNMAFAAIKLCPVFGGKLKSYNFDAIKGRRGVISAVPLTRTVGGGRNAPAVEEQEGVAVVADNWWRARTALDAMPIEWDEGPHAAENSAGYFAQYHAVLDKGNVVFDEGDVTAAMNGPGRTLEAVYEYQHQTVAQMEPPACTVHLTADKVEVWGSEGGDGIVRQAARFTGLPVEKSFFYHAFCGGSFGGAGSDRPPVAHALQIAKTMSGRPVKVVVHREMDMSKGAYRPMGVGRAVAKIGADGMPTAIHFKCVTNSHGRPKVPLGKYEHEVKAEAHSTWSFASVPYAAPNVRSQVTEIDTAIPISTWRAPGHCTADFVIETFIDELAHAGGKDPYQFRRQLIAANKGHDPSFRHKAAWIQALDLVAKASGWGTPLPRGKGRGIGICDRRKHAGSAVQATYTDSALVTIAATVAEVTVTPDGQLTIDRIFISHDKGLEHGGLINPTAVDHQIHGQVAWAWSSFIQEITVDKGRIVQSNFHNYPMIRMKDFPQQFQIIDFAKGEWIAGAGEEAIPGIGPAICNAIFVATGKRIRKLPIRPEDLRWS